MNRNDSHEKSSQDRLISAVRLQWETHGAAAMSARQIGAVAATPVSSIYHHFGSLEHLVLLSQNECLEEAAQWCAEQLSQLEGLPRSSAAFAGFFAQVVDGWCQEQRHLAFAWRECQLLAQRNPFFQDAARRWATLWNDFWQQASDRVAVEGGLLPVQRIFENESFLHMIRWRRLVDRAALDEVARTLAAWLTGAPPEPAPWREYAREEALRSMPALPERDEAAMRIIDAAAQVIDEGGMGSLTHRAVAKRAGSTLGTVSHKFRTKSALVEAAFEGLYRANVERLRPNTPTHPATLNDVAADMAGLIRRRTAASGSDELFVATARDPALRQFGAQLRYLRGRTSRATLQALLGDGKEVSVTEAALLSGFLSAQLRAYTNTPDADVTAQVRGEIETLLKHIASARNHDIR